jgi:hypothetical protein
VQAFVHEVANLKAEISKEELLKLLEETFESMVAEARA